MHAGPHPDAPPRGLTDLAPDALAAREHLATQGWIARRSEAFRHLPPPALAHWLEAPPAAPLPGAGWALQAPAHVQAQRLSAHDSAQRALLFAGLPHPGDAPAPDEAAPFAWAHRALCREGLRVRVSAAAAPTALHLHHVPGARAEAPLLVLDVQAGAHCVLLETHAGGAADAAAGAGLAQNLHLHLRLAPGARLQHLRVVEPGAHDSVAHHVHATLQAGAHYAQALVAAGSGYHLQRTTIALLGAQAQAASAALLLAGQDGRQLDQQAITRVQAPHTASAVETLALAQGGAHAVANAHTHIAPGAEGASVRQRLAGIPLAGHPRLVLRPHLEIHHDNVQAAHGATWGALPQDALFYACQRGLDGAQARALILHGMARAVLERAFAGQLAGAELLAGWLDGGALAAALARHLPPQPEGDRHG